MKFWYFPVRIKCFMSGLHSPWAPYDLFVYNFPYKISGYSGYGACFTLLWASCNFLKRLGQSHTETALKSYGNHAVSAASARESCGACAASVRRLGRDGMVPVQSTCSFGHSCTKSVHLHWCLCCLLKWCLKQI